MERQVDVAVIGAGLAGLAAGAVAARQGARVVVLDARERVGGRARTADEGGFLLNEGPHALYRDGEGMHVLRDLGIEPDGAVPPVAGTMGMLDGRLGLLPSGPVALARTSLLGRRAKWQVARRLATLSRLRPDPLAAVPVGRWIDESVADERARHLLRAIVRVSTYANDPELSAGVAVRQVQRALAGSVLYLHGGWQQLVDGLHRVAAAAGAEVRPSARVAAVRPAGGRVEVDVGGETLAATAVVIATGGPRAAVELLGGALDVDLVGMRPATAAVLDVCLSAPWGDHPIFVLGLDQPTYLSVHAPRARLAPQGSSLVSVMRYLAPGEAVDPGGVRQELEAMLDAVRPRWRDDLVHAGFRRQLIACHDAPSADRGGLAGRPAVRTPIGGVFLAGDWVGSEGILADAALASAAVAGRSAARAVAAVAAAA